ncbi:MFS transporter [Labedaea rhizosphaerae]|uniref:Putative MFS family arabinose efflux permease n=1 Tax=Labedaea rhizosphaerae TaxID=598644 RepID=A0A4R6RSZ5_LABRH|nr:MFS transporter [Labedaea rhizosphaerae]TDP90019.1 putative MFS family arabinose efflux permease [Labedaea rhizosphaerae]
MKRSAVLRGNRDFTLLWLGGLVSGLGSQTATLALPLLVLAKTGSGTLAGLVGTLAGIAALVTMLPGGAVADAVERRRLMLVCEAGSAVAAFALTTAVVADRAVYLAAVLVVLANAVLGSLYLPASAGLLKRMVPAAQLPDAAALLQARTSGVRLAGPLLGGALYGIGPAVPFAVEAVGLVFAVGCLAVLRTKAAPTTRLVAVVKPKEFAAGFGYLLRHPFLRTMLGIGAVLNLVFGGAMLGFVTVAARLDPSGRSSGLIAALAGAGGLVGALLSPRVRADEHPRGWVLVVCLVCAAGMAAVGWWPSVLTLAVVVGCSFLVAATATTVFATVVMIRTPAELQGRVQSAAGFVSMAVTPAGPVAVGALLDGVGVATTFGLLAVVMAVAAVPAWLAPSLRTPAPAFEHVER